jgi:hypothetical protein
LKKFSPKVTEKKRSSEPDPRSDAHKSEKKDKSNLRIRAKSFLSKMVGSKSKDREDGEPEKSSNASPGKSKSADSPVKEEKPSKEEKQEDGKSVKKEKKSKKHKHHKHDNWEKNQVDANDAFKDFMRESKKRIKVT